MRRLKLLVVVLIMCYAVVSLTLNMNGCDNMNNNIINIKKDLRPLNLSDNSGHPDSLTNYFKFYNLDFANDSTDHFFGTFESQGQTLAAHIYKPTECKATVFVMHGYLGHCGLLKLLDYFKVIYIPVDGGDDSSESGPGLDDVVPLGPGFVHC